MYDHPDIRQCEITGYPHYSRCLMCMEPLRFVEQSEADCLEAVKQDGYALQCVEILSPAILEAATVYKEEYAEALRRAQAKERETDV